MILQITSITILSVIGCILIYDTYKSQKYLNDIKKIIIEKEKNLKQIKEENKIIKNKIKNIEEEISFDILDNILDDVLKN